MMYKSSFPMVARCLKMQWKGLTEQERKDAKNRWKHSVETVGLYGRFTESIGTGDAWIYESKETGKRWFLMQLKIDRIDRVFELSSR